MTQTSMARRAHDSETPGVPSRSGLDYFYSIFPSAHKHHFTVKMSVEKFLAWAQSPEASEEVAGTEIHTIYWMKGRNSPAHEYICVSFEKDSKRYQIRIDRASPSWTKIFRRISGLNDQDTVFIPSPFDHNVDIPMAWVSFSSPHSPSFGDLAKLLGVISKSSHLLDKWTSNGWWYASCIWTNLLRYGRASSSWCTGDVVDRWNQASGEYEVRWDFDPRKAARVMQFIHASDLHHALSEDGEHPEELRCASEEIAEAFDREMMGLKDGGKDHGRQCWSDDTTPSKRRSDSPIHLRQFEEPPPAYSSLSSFFASPPLHASNPPSYSLLVV
ncbi:hypothetical protein JAAARDRAFT_205719 [Jaapia argillacea MUCL 33604]|uniref:Uncharacterized protein n=1 Tax=Jaapia argillacea MUCL 33604 TaxID=933084 RepID=A0A067Q0S0_9AGAM|nr:hypothetical protein JAAARDRAFT_205719 [Jaapia argillacea MUCL 33604]